MAKSILFSAYSLHLDNKQNIEALCKAKNEIDQDFYSLGVLFIGKKITLLKRQRKPFLLSIMLTKIV